MTALLPTLGFGEMFLLVTAGVLLQGPEIAAAVARCGDWLRRTLGN